MCDFVVHCCTKLFKLVAEALGQPAKLVTVPIARCGDRKDPCTMALENLKYGNFKPLSVAPESRTLPGFGGQVEDWAN